MSDQDFPTFDALGEQLARIAAAEGSAPRRRVPRRSLVLAVSFVLVLAATAAAGTLLLLRGSVIPAPAEFVAGPTQSPVPGSSRIEPLRARDPGGAPPWAIRVARSKTGLRCTTVGQIVGGRFGLVGLDGRFRLLPDAAVDSCGQAHPGASLVGARVFDARRHDDVRTVVAGDAGPELDRATIVSGGNEQKMQPSDDGAFITVLRGYPEDLSLSLVLHFAGGHTERHDFGKGRFVTADPEQGAAWKLEAGQIGQPLGTPAPKVPTLCVQFRTARQQHHNAISPGACGHLIGVHDGATTVHGLFFAIRTLRPDGRKRMRGIFGGLWEVHPPRTAVWGFAGNDIASVAITGPGGTHPVAINPARLFLRVFPASVDPASLTVVIERANGSTESFHGSHGLVPTPGADR